MLYYRKTRHSRRSEAEKRPTMEEVEKPARFGRNSWLPFTLFHLRPLQMLRLCVVEVKFSFPRTVIRDNDDDDLQRCYKAILFTFKMETRAGKIHFSICYKPCQLNVCQVYIYFTIISWIDLIIARHVFFKKVAILLFMRYILVGESIRGILKISSNILNAKLL